MTRFLLILLLLFPVSAWASDIDTVNKTINYQPGITTNLDKLKFAYEAQEALRIDHNGKGDLFRQGKLAPEDWLAYKAKFNLISLSISAEIGRLNDTLGNNAISDKDTVAQDAYQQLKTDYKASTDWTIDLGDTTAKALTPSFEVPGFFKLLSFEDFTTYTETDPGADLTVTATNIAISTMPRSATAWVVKDFGVGHFQDYTHSIEVRQTTSISGQIAGFGAVTNTVGTRQDFKDASGNAIFCLAYNLSGTNTRWYLFETAAGTEYTDFFTESGNITAWRYFVNTRVEATSTAQSKIYSDSSHTTLLDTLSLTLHSTVDYRYSEPVLSQDDAASEAFSGDIANLDLNESVPPTLRKNIIISSDAWDWSPERWAWVRESECVKC